MSVSADGGVRAEGGRGHARALQLLANTVLTCLAYETDSECKRAQLECLVALPPPSLCTCSPGGSLGQWGGDSLGVEGRDSLGEGGWDAAEGCGGRACWGACWWRGTQSAVGG